MSRDFEQMRRQIARSQQGDERARHELIEANVRLVWSIIQRFQKRGVEQDDLFQIGCIGLMKAIDKFDLRFEVKFSTYAVPMIIGEIQRFLRDDGAVKVSRSLKELGFKAKRLQEERLKVQNEEWNVAELAEVLDVDVQELVLAQESLRQPTSIYEAVYESDGEALTHFDQLRDEEDEWQVERIEMKKAMAQLAPREQVIIYLRYFRDETQAEVAKRLGVSQVQVSRLEKKIIAHLKRTMMLE